MQERFKQLLEAKQLTATRFATLIKVNASAMSHILNGRSKPGFDVLDKIAQAFPDVNLNWLISGKGSLYNQPPQQVQVSVEKTIPENEKKEKMQELPGPVTTPPLIQSEPLPSPVNSALTSKKVKRIVLFFDDGSFEDYEK